MALPRIDGIFSVITLPVAGISTKVYGFTIKEQRNLVLAKDAADANEIEEVIISLLKNKVPEVDIESLTMTDIIFLFISMLRLSKGVAQKFSYICKSTLEDGLCNTKIDVDVSLDNFVINKSEKFSNSKLVHVADNINIELVYPTYRHYKELKAYESNKTEYIFRLYSKCISAVYSGEDANTEFTDDEIYDWIMSLPGTVLSDFESFINSIPTLSLKYDVVCPKCGSSKSVVINNIIDFFTRASQENR